MVARRRTSVLVDEALLRKARKAFKASTNTETITKALEQAVQNHEIEVTLLLDTNIYLFAMKSAAGAELFERRFLALRGEHSPRDKLVT